LITFPTDLSSLHLNVRNRLHCASRVRSD
jgi:hypothetical protein